MSPSNPEAEDDRPLPDDLSGSVERRYTCTACGYATTHEVAPLRPTVQSTCANCADWTVQTAPADALVEAARDAAAALAGDVLTERQALAYLLRDVVGVDRARTADAMDASASNVDNLQRRGREKVADARRVVAGLDALVATDATRRSGEASTNEQPRGGDSTSDAAASGDGSTAGDDGA